MPDANTEIELGRRDARRLEPGEKPGAFREFRSDARFGNRLGFRFANGAMRSLPYLHLIETHYEPDLGVILTFAGHRISIVGRNLTELYLRLEEEVVCEIFERHDWRDLEPVDPAEREAWRVAPFVEKSTGSRSDAPRSGRRLEVPRRLLRRRRAVELVRRTSPRP